MLYSKDQLFNWVVPSKMTQGSIIKGIRVNIKNKTTTIGGGWISDNRLDLSNKDLNVAFILDGNKSFLVFNPKEGIPFYKFRCSNLKNTSKYHSIVCGLMQLTLLFKSNFMITTDIKDFGLEKFEEINGMLFWKILE